MTQQAGVACRCLCACLILSGAFIEAVAAQQLVELRKARVPTTPTQATQTLLGDVDGDGALDVLLFQSAKVQLYRNDGRGSFTHRAPVQLPFAPEASSAVLGDVDGDGDADMVIGSLSQDRLFINDGQGIFTDETLARMPALNDVTLGVAVGDVDGDGDPDIATSNAPSFTASGQDRLYLNDGRGFFTDATVGRLPAVSDNTRGILLEDVDRDGDRDLIIAANAQQPTKLYLNDGRAYFSDVTSTHMPADVGPTVALVAGDVNGDGAVEFVLTRANSPWLYVHINDRAGRFALAPTLPSGVNGIPALAFADVDGDGDLDLVATFSAPLAPGMLLINDGRGRFADETGTRFPPERFPGRSVAVGDVDGDGAVDLFFGTDANHRDRLYINDKAGCFEDSERTGMPFNENVCMSTVIGDLDGDGDQDMIFTDLFGAAMVYRNEGHGRFAIVGLLDPPATFEGGHQAVLADVDADADVDVAIGNRRNRTQLFLNRGNGTFVDATFTNMPAGSTRAQGIAFGDLDGDGDTDLAAAQGDGVVLLWNDGRGRFTFQGPPVLVVNGGAVALGDVDGDRDLDVIVGTRFNGTTDDTLKLLLNDGGRLFRNVTATHLPFAVGSTFDLLLRDVDGDGALDVVAANFFFEPDWLFLNRGDGRFTNVSSRLLPKSGYHYSVAAGDLDEDGDLDLLFAGSVLQLFRNDGTGRFISSVMEPRPRGVAVGDVDDDGDLDVALAAEIAPYQNRLFFNLHRQIHGPDAALTGRQYSFEFTSRPGYGTLASIAVAIVGNAARIPLPPFGVFGIDPTTAVKLPPVIVPAPDGRIAVEIAIPQQASLIGQTFYAQALIVDLLVPARLTNTLRDVVR